VGIDDASFLFLGVRADEAEVRGQEKTFFELYEQGHYGPDSRFEQDRYVAHNLVSWINATRPHGLEADTAGEDYGGMEACEAFVGRSIGEAANPRDTGYWVEVALPDLEAVTEEVATALREAFGIVTPPRLYILKHVS